MKKRTTVTRIAITLTIIVIVIALIIGTIVAFGIGGEMFSKAIDGVINGHDIEKVGSLFVLLGLVGMSLGFLLYLIMGVCLFIAPIWIVWGIVKLIQKARNKRTENENTQNLLNGETNVLASDKKSSKTIITLVSCITVIFVILLFFGNIDINVENNWEYAKENTIGALAYNYCGEEKVIYIKEYGKYEPYLVLHNNDYGEGNTLLLRKNVIGGYFEYIERPYLEKIPKEYIHIEAYTKYEDSSVDTYLQGDFQNRFDTDILETINTTQVGLCSTRGSSQGLKKEEYNINRKFFLLSLEEVAGLKNIEKYKRKTCNNSDNNKELKYFIKNRNNLITLNDAGEEANWWIRNYNISHYFCISHDGYVRTGYEEQGIRPAFTINSGVRVKEIYNEEYGKNIYVFDL